MPVDAGGNATRPTSPVPVSGQTADAPQVNVPINDIYAILNMLVFLDGRKSLRGNIPMNGHRARGAGDAEQPQDYVTLAQLQALVTGLGVPSGVISPFSGVTAPPGWVIANGATLSRATFPNLWAHAQASGILAPEEVGKGHGQYGPGDGSTTFSIPNLSVEGYFVRSTYSGRPSGSGQSDAFKSHAHSGTTSANGSHAHLLYLPQASSITSGGGVIPGVATSTQALYSTEPAGNHTHTFTTSSNGDTETRPKNIAYPFIIKA